MPNETPDNLEETIRIVHQDTIVFSFLLWHDLIQAVKYLSRPAQQSAMETPEWAKELGGEIVDFLNDCEFGPRQNEDISSDEIAELIFKSKNLPLVCVPTPQTAMEKAERIDRECHHNACEMGDCSFDITGAAQIIAESQAELRGLLEKTLTYLENIFGAIPSDRLERIISKITAALDGKEGMKLTKERNQMAKKKELNEMTIVELLNHYNSTVDEDGRSQGHYRNLIEAIMNEWPFSEITALQAEVNKLQDRVHNLSVAVKFK